MNPLAMQVFIAISGPLAFWLATRERRRVRMRAIGFWLGLLGQPIWLYETWAAGMWGFFVTALLWTGVWAQGVWETTFQPRIERIRSGGHHHDTAI